MWVWKRANPVKMRKRLKHFEPYLALQYTYSHTPHSQLTPSLGATPVEIRMNLDLCKNQNLWTLRLWRNHDAIVLLVSMQYQSVTDRRTDGQTD